MNNRYIFRGKRKDTGEWVYGNLINNAFFDNDGFPIFYILDTDNIKYDCWEDIAEEINYFEVIPKTVGQCTGLKDKNGKWIFEGNIVKLTDINNGVEWRAYVVFGNPYGEYNWGWNLMYIGEKPKVNTDILLWVEMEETGAYCEVIGNIHDNRELLEVER